MGEGRAVWLVGSPLLKAYYTAWTGLDLRVGFATLCGTFHLLEDSLNILDMSIKI